jgi:acyl-CoA thioesterase-1
MDYVLPMMRKTLLYTAIYLVVLISGCSSENSQTPNMRDQNSGVSEAPADSAATRGEEESVATMEEVDRTDAGTVRILYLGDSIAAGYGLGEDQAFPNLVQKKAEAAGYSTETVNAGVSGDTSTGGLSRIDWLLKNRVDILVLELGGNDGLRGIDLSLTRENLSQIILRTRERWPAVQIVVAGMMVPPNLGHEYTEQFRTMFPSLAKEHKTQLIPFVLDGVGGIADLNQSDGIHPTAKGHELIAETVWDVIEPLLVAKP